MGLTGVIDIDSLLSLRYLRTISLMNNNFEGPLPDFKKLGALKSLYLSNNRFSGEIPDHAFSGMGYLKKVLLANNKFTGNIPTSLAELPRLIELRLDGNQFEGHVPDFQQKGLKFVNLANNELEGPIPPSLSKMDASLFSGNKNLCGKPLDPCGSHKTMCASKIAIIMLVLGLILVFIAAVFFFIKWQKRKAELVRSSSVDSNKLPSFRKEELEKLPEPTGPIRRSDHGNKLFFLTEDIEKFDLQDLLRASAEVLGSGTFGSSYKAVVMGDQAVVVKRYKQMNNVGREDFHEHMRRLGRLKHPNVLPLAAYYYRKEEKLLISKFVDNRCLATHLHGKHSAEQSGLDWQTRLRIIKGVTKGLAYLYSELPSLILTHGHLKSSNVLLDESMEPLLTDYALRPVFNPDHAHMFMTAYKTPEYAQIGHVTKKSDIWCLGILILECLTGKFPENYLTQGYDSNADLATWVNDMVKEKRTSEVFDKDMGGMKNSKGEMINLLKIGLRCCEVDVERRMELKEVVAKIEELKEENIDENYSVYGNEGNAFSSRGTEDDFSFSMNG
ncbi:Pkinase domain-containing protein/LRR_8 domain-containing protein [Cephalotus follicularis]|uniref:non-specific serine/threonine protein kinase n=1 Tax=Cephalotus follicularis TaxID=3775 RepID=A0A1Q3CMG2_CEPFO|nr:Pkinase domain-containing protein/LRR_8 domain-containing protein [Cephalotus follicularis]